MPTELEDFPRQCFLSMRLVQYQIPLHSIP